MAFMSQLLPISDSIHLTGIPSTLSIGLDAWSRPAKPQPITISLQISHSVVSAASKDDVFLTLDYGKLYKRLTNELEILNSNYSTDITLQGVVNVIDAAISSPSSASQSSTTAPPCIITITLPKAALRCLSGITYSSIRLAPDSPLYAAGLEIKRIDCPCIVGVNPHERREKQSIYVTLEFRARLPSNRNHHSPNPAIGRDAHSQGAEEEDDDDADQLPNSTFCTHTDLIQILTSYQTLIREISDLVDGTAYETLEALATHIARHVTMRYFSAPAPLPLPLPPPPPSSTSPSPIPTPASPRRSVAFSPSPPSSAPIPKPSSPAVMAAALTTTTARSPPPLSQPQPTPQMGKKRRKGSSAVTVFLEKPSAIAMVEAAGVRITRTRRFFEEQGEGFWRRGSVGEGDERGR